MAVTPFLSRQQLGELFRRQGEQGASLPDHRVRELFFAFLQTQDFFLNGVLGDQLVKPARCFFWPERWARSVACSWAERFHQGS